MKDRFFLLSMLMFCVLAAWSTQPIRTLRLRLPDGSYVEQFVSETGINNIHTCHRCPSRFSDRFRDTRSLYAVSSDGLGVEGRRSRGVLNSIGEPKIPVILVEFSDVALRPETTSEKVDSLFNGQTFRLNERSRGSVRSYFQAQSYGRFSPKFTIVGKVKLSRDRAYYGGNSGGSKNKNAYEMYSEAITLATQQGVDFRPFVENGGVPLTVLLHAGPGEHNAFETGRDNYPWAHFREVSLTVNDVYFKSYFIGCELVQSYQTETVEEDGKSVTRIKRDDKGNPLVAGAELEGIGVFCHEMSHALGLPDFYSTNGTSTSSPDYHDIMDYGQYGNGGFRPFGYSAYERNYMGWLAFEELREEAGFKVLAPLNSLDDSPHPKAYLLRNPKNEKEYLTLENRQPSAWFSPTLGTGLLVYRYVYDEDAWRYNEVNIDPIRMGCQVIPADAQWQGHKTGKPAEFQGDFYPGAQQVTECSPVTNPALAWQTLGGDARPLYGIAETDNGNVSFAYLDATLVGIGALPVSTAATSSSVLFGLDGRRVQLRNIQPGLYIRNGKKVVIGRTSPHLIDITQ